MYAAGLHKQGSQAVIRYLAVKLPGIGEQLPVVQFLPGRPECLRHLEEMLLIMVDELELRAFQDHRFRLALLPHHLFLQRRLRNEPVDLQDRIITDIIPAASGKRLRPRRLVRKGSIRILDAEPLLSLPG